MSDVQQLQLQRNRRIGVLTSLSAVIVRSLFLKSENGALELEHGEWPGCVKDVLGDTIGMK